ncbi:type II toxin-antitoxin system VapC family toxin [Methylocystis parvus]|uniref:Ribonuclease VapC n=1 Tax=Methylocystis parvus TaxID=134 RepID=A0A6B8MC59_9HYPH|nr:type II toxin-antitoxin system VapC family toxin [Methylocystis parvus]QGM99975.1 type II toxin-antitoxin system VapC family toxin [Methylocystis parvus]WBK02206.1 type II toxin-antitoxin system VapC family toxin [Methylocystis parvus OBBP]
MAYVLDASFAAAWFLPDEASDLADRLLGEILANPPVVPSLFRHELRNLFLVAERRNRVSSSEIDEALTMLATLPIAERGSAADYDVLRLARKHGLTAYDAAYLALAQSDGLPLATLDKKMLAAARGENIAVIGPPEAS